MDWKNALLLLGLIVVAACQGEVRVMSQNPGETAEKLVRGQVDERFYRMSVSLRIRRADGNAICSGTLIEKDVVLTAAHCVEGLASPVQGDAIIAEATAQLSRYGLGRNIEVHPSYREDHRRFDLALVKLEFETVPNGSAEILQREFVNVARARADWVPGQSQNLILTGSGIKVGYLEAPFERPLVEAANFRGSVEIERAGALRTVWDFFQLSSFVPGDLMALSAGEKSPWLCAGDSGGGLFAENPDRSVVLVGVNSRSKMFSYQGKTMCMPSGMIATPISPHLAWIERSLKSVREQ